MRNIIIALVLFIPFALQADVLKMNEHGVQIKQNANAPIRGMTKNTVRKQYGEPSGKKSAVGKPPISRWDYPGYSVFFEHHIVLHTVVHNG